MHKNIKSKPFRDALRDVPEGVDKSDWEWLVKEHFLTEKFKVRFHNYLLISSYIKWLIIILVAYCQFRKQV